MTCSLCPRKEHGRLLLHERPFQISLTTYKSRGCHEGLKLQGKSGSKVIFQQTLFHMRRAINVTNNQWGFTLPEPKPYMKTVHGFILFGHTTRQVKSAPVPAFIASRFVFIFLRFLKKKEITDAVTHLLVLPLALMENVKGAQPCWGQADIASERWPSHKTDVYCFS